MALQQWHSHIFGMFVGGEFVKNSGKNISTPISPVGPQFTGAPIEKFDNFVSDGKTDMDIPVRKRLTGRPVFGDNTLKGTGEKSIVTYRTVPINYTRKAYQPPTGMSEQISRPYADQLVTNAHDQLGDWLNNYWPGNFMCSIFKGYSYDLNSVAQLGGRAKATISHPNFFTAGGGQVSQASLPGTAGYETAVAAALNGLTNTAEDKMSVDLLRNLVVSANRLKINPITLKGGFKFFPIFISDSQWVQLQQDAEYIDIVKRGQNTPLTDNPLVNAASFWIAGACIYVDQNLWGARTSDDDATVTETVEYGPVPSTKERADGNTIGNWIANVSDTNTKKLGVLMGASAFSLGVGARLKFTEESDDHGFFKEIGLNFIQSVVRNDVYDLDGMVGTAGNFDYNDSSLVFATYSPYALAWS